MSCTYEVIFDNYLLKNLHGYKMVMSIGYDEKRTDYREVFLVTKNDKEYIMKIGRTHIIPEKNNKTITEEIELQYKMSNMELSPRIIDVWEDVLSADKCELDVINVQCFIMEKWTISYADYRPQPQTDAEKELICNQLYKLIYDEQFGIISRFHKMTGLIHGDAHAGNIVLELDQDEIPIKASLIDFETCYLSTDLNIINELYPGWNLLRQMYGSIQQYEQCRFHNDSMYNMQMPFVCYK